MRDPAIPHLEITHHNHPFDPRPETTDFQLEWMGHTYRHVVSRRQLEMGGDEIRQYVMRDMHMAVARALMERAMPHMTTDEATWTEREIERRRHG